MRKPLRHRLTKKDPPQTLFQLQQQLTSLGHSSGTTCVDCSSCISTLCTGCEPCLALRGGDSFLPPFSEAGPGAEAASVRLTIPLNAWKCIFQFLLTSLNVLCWFIPLRAKNFGSNKLLLGLANAFSGGVFLSLAFGHLIPECVRGFGSDWNEAVPHMVVLFGYLLIFFFEKVAFDSSGLVAVNEKETDNENENENDKENDNEDEQLNTQAQSADNCNTKGHSKTTRSAVILLGALAVHSVLEMTALGLADTFSDSALLSLSIALHQPAESIALLVAFLKSGMPKKEIFYFLSAFSCMGPIGVAIGMAVNEFAAPIVDAFMLATVAGTFIYVGATEVIPEEWEHQEHKFKKFFSLIGGIVTIFGITQYTAGLESL
ncbi:hypothetical protein ScalyP_jg2156 [Parmales sp. scaly parma]|nr:hypothetical protein ScalyP_jg2156 [Parmales sp. scaly parma]